MENLTQNQRLDCLIDWLKGESYHYRNLKVDGDHEKKKATLRALMNIRMPRNVPMSIMTIQDEYLQQERQAKGVVALDAIPPIAETLGSGLPFGSNLALWQGDITTLEVDAIVNAANNQLLGCFIPNHHCIDNAIHSGAGMALRLECANYMNGRQKIHGDQYLEPTGQAMITNGYNLAASYVIHTVGPIVTGKLEKSHRIALKSCYHNVLERARETGLRTLALCCISTGEYHFPNQEAAHIAVATIRDYLENHGDCFDLVIFNVFKDQDYECYKNVLSAMK